MIIPRNALLESLMRFPKKIVPSSVIGDGFADVDAFVVVIFKMLKIVSIGKINRRRWPLLGGRHHPSILVNQRDERGLRQTRQAVGQCIIRILVLLEVPKIILGLAPRFSNRS